MNVTTSTKPKSTPARAGAATRPSLAQLPGTAQAYKTVPAVQQVLSAAGGNGVEVAAFGSSI